MIRLSYWDKYEGEVDAAFKELSEKCRINVVQGNSHSGDLLLCGQNGSLFFDGLLIGPGEEGANNQASITSITYRGIGDDTADDNYFKDNGRQFFRGTTDFEHSIQREKYRYLDIWENVYFLRVLTQVVNVSNGIDYDWELNLSKLTAEQKSAHIRAQIIQRLSVAPKFQQAMKVAYVGQIRNAIAHRQYHIVSGGIEYDNYGIGKYAHLSGLTFEEWEQKNIYSYVIFAGLFRMLNDLRDLHYYPLSKKMVSKGILIKTPGVDENTRGEMCIYPNHNGTIWRFVK